MMTERQERELMDNDFEIIEDEKYEKCIECPLNRVCMRAFEGKVKKKEDLKLVECAYEKEGKWDDKRKLFHKWQSFVDMDPKYFMEKMMMNYDVLEQEAKADFSFAKGMQLQYLLMSIYKMKFGERKEIQNNTVSASVDIKTLMDKMRDDK